MRPSLLIAAIFVGALLLPAGVTGQDAAADPLPEPGTILEPGRYSSSIVGPTIDFRVDDGWVVGPSGDGPIFTLEYLKAPGAVLSITRFDGEAFLDSCDPSSMTVVEPGVPRLAEIIGGNPFLNPGAPEVIDVAGYTGVSLDVGVPEYTECALPYLLIWAVPIGDGGEFVQVPNQQSRFLIFDVADSVIVVAIESFPGVPFGAVLEAAMELVGTMRIEPGEYLPPEPTLAPSLEPEAPASPALKASPAPGAARTEAASS